MLNEGEIFFNCNSSYNMNLRLTEYPTIPRLNEEYEDIPVEGKNGNLTINKGTYKDRTIPFTFTILSDDIVVDFDRVEEWFTNIKDNALFYEKEDKAYRVKKIVLGDFQKEFKSIGSFKVDFICKSFMESVNKLTYKYTQNPIFYYNGHFKAEPIITVIGSGTIQISFNNETFTINNVVTSVTINTELMACVLADGTNAIWNGNFPTIQKGQNTVSVTSGTVSEITTEFYALYR